MTRILIALAASAAVAGCFMSPQERMAQDEATCRAYGAAPGTEPYINCMMEQARRRDAYAARQAAIWSGLGSDFSNMRAPQAHMPQAQRPLNCSSTPNHLGGYNTSCQ